MSAQEIMEYGNLFDKVFEQEDVKTLKTLSISEPGLFNWKIREYFDEAPNLEMVKFLFVNELLPEDFIHKMGSHLTSEILSTLIENGFDVDTKDRFGYALLHIYTPYEGKNSFGIVKILLENDANPNIEAENKQTPLNIVIEKEPKKLETIKLLLDYGADIKQQSIEYLTERIQFLKEMKEFSQVRKLKAILKLLQEYSEKRKREIDESLNPFLYKVLKKIIYEY